MLRWEKLSLAFSLAGNYYKSAQLEYYKFTQRLLQICSGITNLLQICAGITNMRITKVNTIVNFLFVFKYSCFQMVKNHMHFEHKYAITKGLSSVEISPTIVSKSIVFLKVRNFENENLLFSYFYSLSPYFLQREDSSFFFF